MFRPDEVSPTGDVTGDTLDVREEIARIYRARAESDKFVAEQRKLMAESDKFIAEQRKLIAEADTLSRDRMLAPWQIIMSSMAAGAALFGAGAAFIKLFGH